MGEVKVEVTLENAFDRERCRRGEISQAQVRSASVRVLTDSGAVTIMLPQDLVEALGLEEVGKAIVTYADERKEERPVAGIVTVRVGDRMTSLNCIVGPPSSEPLLGQVALETLDLLVDCTRQRLVPRPESPFLPLLYQYGDRVDALVNVNYQSDPANNVLRRRLPYTSPKAHRNRAPHRRALASWRSCARMD